MTRSELKARARQKLGGGLFQQNWLYAVLATLIFSALVSISSAAVIGPILLTGPLTYGLSYLYLKQSRTGNKMELAEIFEGFKADFVGNFLLGFLQSLFIALWSMLFVIPGIVKQYSWSMAYYVKIDHPDYDWRACLDEKQAYHHGPQGRAFPARPQLYRLGDRVRVHLRYRLFLAYTLHDGDEGGILRSSSRQRYIYRINR